MTINEYERGAYELADIALGGLFRYQNRIYMRLDETGEQNENLPTAVDIENGTPKFFDLSTTKVNKVGHYLTITDLETADPEEE